jgi:S1-C subfamily serine protease
MLREYRLKVLPTDYCFRALSRPISVCCVSPSCTQVVRPLIGITYLESSQAKALGIEKGVLVLDVPKGTPGERAGKASS